MRDAYHEELAALTDALVEMTRLVGSAISRASTALLDADLTLAESVIHADDAVDALRDDLDRRAMDLLARQQPVASDLRTIVTTLKMSADLERMGDLARHVARAARRRFPDPAVPAPLRATIVEMGQVAERLVAKAGGVIASHDVAAALEIERDDDAMDRLHRELFTALLDVSEPYGIEAAIDVTLVEPLLRALRRPRRRRVAPGGLPGHRPAAAGAHRAGLTVPVPVGADEAVEGMLRVAGRRTDRSCLLPQHGPVRAPLAHLGLATTWRACGSVRPSAEEFGHDGTRSRAQVRWRRARTQRVVLSACDPDGQQ